jgi:hypothetical protein
MTREIERRFAELGDQDDKGDDAIVVAKFFTPDSSWTWFAVAYFPEDRTFFGLVDGHFLELGYFALEELESVTGPLGLHIERDLHWKERTLGEVRASLESRVRP